MRIVYVTCQLPEKSQAAYKNDARIEKCVSYVLKMVQFHRKDKYMLQPAVPKNPTPEALCTV
jgi:hypothetical protein